MSKIIINVTDRSPFEIITSGLPRNKPAPEAPYSVVEGEHKIMGSVVSCDPGKDDGFIKNIIQMLRRLEQWSH